MAGVPELSSLPEAEMSIYLDFDGHHEAEWGDFFHPEEGYWYDVTTPVFSTDDNADYSAMELQMIEQIWRCVAEDYAPFHINVTTVEPDEFEFGSGLRVAIGGSDDDWYQGDAGGVAQRRSYAMGDLVNTVYVFSEDYWQIEAPRMIADTASHEAGHAFGLAHQSLRVDGEVVDEYLNGDGLRAPIMGSSYFSARSLWWRQDDGIYVYDDMKNLNDPNAGNYGIPFRTDDHGGTLATATVIDSTDSPIGGVIATNEHNVDQGNDIDCFVVTLPENSLLKMWRISVGVDGYAANLDARLEVYQVAGEFLQLVGASDPDNALGGSVYFTGQGDYLIKVMSHGGYGDLGQYALSIGQTSIIQPYDDWFTRPPLIDIVCDPLTPVEIFDPAPVRVLPILRLDVGLHEATKLASKAITETSDMLTAKRDAERSLKITADLHDLALLEFLKGL
jgi:hypothetical protein